MDRKRSALNIAVSIIFRFLILVTSLITRRYLIQYIGNEINGLDSLYASILGFLSVAELGVGTAIVFCMYTPIVEKNNEKVAALYQLFSRVYWIIGGVILAVGTVFMFFIPYIAKDYAQLEVDIYRTFFLTLVSVVLTYAFNSKLSLINAYKQNYISTAISSSGVVLQYILQAIVVVFTSSYELYLICKIFTVLLQWGVTDYVTRKKYAHIVSMSRQKVDIVTKRDIMRNIKALFLQRIGGILVDSTSSIIVSAFIGVVVLGKYSNYSMIAVAVISIISLFFTPLTSIIGHVYVENKDALRNYFAIFYGINFILGLVFFVGYYAIIDNLVELMLGNNLQLSRSISFVITLNYFVKFMRQSYILFKDATGTFFEDRWRPLIEGSINIVLSIVLVVLFRNICGEEYGVVGVCLATIITNLTVCHTMEPYVLYKKIFKSSAKPQMIKNLLLTGVFVFALLIMDVLRQSFDNHFAEMLVNGILSLCITSMITVAIVLVNRDLRERIVGIVKKRR